MGQGSQSLISVNLIAMKKKENQSRPKIVIGTSGYSFPQWKGTVYPSNLKNKDMLDYYQRELGFKMVEINSTFYRMPDPKAMHSLCCKTTPEFEILVKANREMTHDIQGQIADNSGIFAQFKEGIKPLIDEGKLSAVIFQFPPSFKKTPQNLGYLAECKKRMGQIPIAVELRHESWNVDDTFSFLKENQIGYCATDLPISPQMMPFVEKATTDKGFIRLHGNGLPWKDEDGHLQEHLYSPDELKGLKMKIIRLQQKEGPNVVYIAFNNCHAGAALLNALQLKRALGIPLPAPVQQSFNF